MQHELRTVAIDLAKKVFHLVGTDTLGACPRINVYGPLIPRQLYGEGVWMGTPAVSISTVVRHNWFTDGMTPCQEVLAVPMAPRVGVTQ